MLLKCEQICCDAERRLPELDAGFQNGVHILHRGSPRIDSKFMQLVGLTSEGGAIACTGSVLDVLASNTLRYVRNKGQRRFAMFFFQHPDAIGPTYTSTAIVHEAGHFLSDESPARDEPDETAAVEMWWKSMGADSHLDHNRRWLRATVHLWARVTAFGVADVPVELLLGQYVAMPDAVVGSLRSELNQLDTPIEDILNTRAPRKFTEVCDLMLDGKLPRDTRRKPSKRKQSPAATTPRKQPSTNHTMLVGGRIVQTRDGVTRIDGRTVSESEFRALCFGRKRARKLGLSQRANQLTM